MLKYINNFSFYESYNLIHSAFNFEYITLKFEDRADIMRFKMLKRRDSESMVLEKEEEGGETGCV